MLSSGAAEVVSDTGNQVGHIYPRGRVNLIPSPPHVPQYSLSRMPASLEKGNTLDSIATRARRGHLGSQSKRSKLSPSVVANLLSLRGSGSCPREWCRSCWSLW